MIRRLTNLRDLVDLVTDRNPEWRIEFEADHIECSLRGARLHYGVRYEDMDATALALIEHHALISLGMLTDGWEP